MSNVFADEVVKCPACAKLPHFEGERCVPLLVCSTRNYSGFGVDIARCEWCGKAYQVSYTRVKIDEVTRLRKWDGPAKTDALQQEVRDLIDEIDRKRAQIRLLEHQILP